MEVKMEKSNQMLNGKAVLNGKAGELLVCADLMIKGYVVSIVEGDLPFDILLLLNGKIYKIQVKASEAKGPLSTGYLKKLEYSKTDVDIFALAFLPSKTIGYFSYDEIYNSDKNIIYADKRAVDEWRDKRKSRILKLYQSGMDKKAIAEEFNTTINIISSFINGTFPLSEYDCLENHPIEKVADLLLKSHE